MISLIKRYTVVEYYSLYFIIILAFTPALLKPEPRWRNPDRWRNPNDKPDGQQNRGSRSGEIEIENDTKSRAAVTSYSWLVGSKNYKTLLMIKAIVVKMMHAIVQANVTCFATEFLHGLDKSVIIVHPLRILTLIAVDQQPPSTRPSTYP
ncbi:hypothetical protein EVAR_58952_1 [Eumeta japonica]|uniref:Uncharacterized protein n=1 Tax=Eumeta variegata TaxID=151549 RepID=A0A4C1YEY3_EUMVA|nr:hypothetical protein EVAR_58952_1 [Eumeta japonica]